MLKAQIARGGRNLKAEALLENSEGEKGEKMDVQKMIAEEQRR